MQTKRSLGILLALALILSLLSIAPATANAADDIGIQAGLPTFAVNTDSPTLVGFGGKQWAVIGYDGNGVASTIGSKLLTLLLANGESYGKSAFDASNTSNEYFGSDLKAKMESAFGTLAPKEQELVDGRNFAGGAVFIDGSDEVAGAAVNGAKFWPLSYNEADALNLAVLATGSWWWLRSPGGTQYYASFVSNNDIVSHVGLNVNFEGGVRPALWLNLANVLFTSDASGANAKSTASVGDGLIKALPSSGAVKFTMKDSSLELVKVTATSRNNDTVSFNYTGATAGNTLSAVVLDSSNAVKYYGKLAYPIPAGGSGTASLTLPSDFATTDTVQIFVEEANGDNETDFASVYKELSLGSPVCEIGSTQYYDLASALAAVGPTETATIKLLQDITYNSRIRITTAKTITFDLNGKTLDATNALRVEGGGQVLLADPANGAFNVSYNEPGSFLVV